MCAMHIPCLVAGTISVDAIYINAINIYTSINICVNINACVNINPSINTR